MAAFDDANAFLAIFKDEYRPMAKDLVEKCDWSWFDKMKNSRGEKLPIKALRDYQVFLISRVIARDVQMSEGCDRLFLSPTVKIDQVWHEHMLYPILYAQSCQRLYASSPYHPNKASDSETTANPNKRQRLNEDEDEDDEEDDDDEEEEEEEGVDCESEEFKEDDQEVQGVRLTEIIDHTPDSVNDKKQVKEIRICRFKQYVSLISNGYQLD